MYWPLTTFYKRQMKLAMNQTVAGRCWDPGEPERGRILPHQVNSLHRETWHRFDQFVLQADLRDLPSLGNRHNVFLAVLTTAGYHAFLDAGLERQHAISLIADAGWKLYTKFVGIPRSLASLATRDKQKRLNLILRMLMKFPFNAPGRPGYEVQAWADDNVFRTDWTYCPPLEFVKKFVENNGDRGEAEMFRQSWCSYDWAFTYAMLNGGHGDDGHYQRPRTLSKGDEVCEMYWYARPPAVESADCS